MGDTQIALVEETEVDWKVKTEIVVLAAHKVQVGESQKIHGVLKRRICYFRWLRLRRNGARFQCWRRRAGGGWYGGGGGCSGGGGGGSSYSDAESQTSIPYQE